MMCAYVYCIYTYLHFRPQLFYVYGFTWFSWRMRMKCNKSRADWGLGTSHGSVDRELKVTLYFPKWLFVIVNSIINHLVVYKQLLCQVYKKCFCSFNQQTSNQSPSVVYVQPSYHIQPSNVAMGSSKPCLMRPEDKSPLKSIHPFVHVFTIVLYTVTLHI